MFVLFRSWVFGDRRFLVLFCKYSGMPELGISTKYITSLKYCSSLICLWLFFLLGVGEIFIPLKGNIHLPTAVAGDRVPKKLK